MHRFQPAPPPFLAGGNGHTLFPFTSSLLPSLPVRHRHSCRLVSFFFHSSSASLAEKTFIMSKSDLPPLLSPLRGTLFHIPHTLNSQDVRSTSSDSSMPILCEIATPHVFRDSANLPPSLLFRTTSGQFLHPLKSWSPGLQHPASSLVLPSPSHHPG